MLARSARAVCAEGYLSAQWTEKQPYDIGQPIFRHLLNRHPIRLRRLLLGSCWIAVGGLGRKNDCVAFLSTTVCRARRARRRVVHI